MKVRSGFVSNSSSASFVVMTTFEAHEKALERLNDQQAAFIRQLVSIKDMAGQKIVCHGGRDRDGAQYTFGNAYGADQTGEYPNEWFDHSCACGTRGNLKQEVRGALFAYEQALRDLGCYMMMGLPG